MTPEPKHEWEVNERFPRYDDRQDFEVWDGRQTRRVRRIGNRDYVYAPGTLIAVDCTHPAQNALFDERLIKGWRVAP